MSYELQKMSNFHYSVGFSGPQHVQAFHTDDTRSDLIDTESYGLLKKLYNGGSLSSFLRFPTTNGTTVKGSLRDRTEQATS